MSHPIAFSRAYLLATCFCVFSFIFRNCTVPTRTDRPALTF
nr:MAG TPA: hypothetical protein [Caudoviricetes sp.]